jgi:aryl-alcohol dehydrogenase-like predicted oxidoreductase
MQYGLLPGVDRPLSRLIQGTLTLAHATLGQANELLDAVYSAGCRAFDTAPVYGRGLAEQRLGKWLRERALPDVVIIDKGAHPREGRSRVTPSDIEVDLVRSLDALRRERIDLYLLHRDRPDVPVGELIDCLNEQVERGRIGRFGASNWSHQRILKANRYAEQNEKLGFVASSPEFSLAVPVTSWTGCLSIAGPKGAEARAWYTQTQLPVLAWSPLASGFLSGADTSDSAATSDRERRVLEFYASPDNFARRARLGQMALSRGTSPSALALAYVMSSKMNTYAVVGCRSAGEFRECLGAAKLRLAPKETSWLESEDGQRAHFSKL